MLRNIPYAETRAEAERLGRVFTGGAATTRTGLPVRQSSGAGSVW